MKGLLYKDWIVLWRQLRMVFLFVLVFGAVPGDFQNIFAVTYTAMIPLSILSVDESSKWDDYAAMLPYSVREAVLSKYLLGWCCMGGAAVLVGAAQAVIRPLTHTPPLDDGNLLIALWAAVLAADLMLPLTFRFGLERARILTFLLVGVTIGIASALSEIKKSGAALPALSLPLGVVIAAAATVLSLLLSCRCYERRHR